jgi:FtsP/CotA-like multicopper oxidase with cupredoxin domain
MNTVSNPNSGRTLTKRKIIRLRGSTRLFLLVSLGTSLLATAATLDEFGPPPAGDPSAHTGPIISESLAEDLVNKPPVYKGAIEGGPTGTAADQSLTGSIPEDDLSGGAKYNIPTNSKPSPLFGAKPFTQQILRFEEFGTEPLDPRGPTPTLSFPGPSVGPLPAQDPSDLAKSSPDSAAIEAFLAEPGIAPFPKEFSNVEEPNPWKASIEAYLGRPLNDPPAEGRPPGQGWAHQRWKEFYPVQYYETAQVGARVNGGFRDKRQRHGYAVGEWAPGGLYNNTTGSPGNAGTTAGIGIRFHPDMPTQEHKSLWTFDGTLPPKLLNVRYGQPVLMRHYNALPIDVTANRGFGMHTLTTHEHNGHSPAESDGFAGAFFFPGQFYDYRWPITLAGYDSINTDASDPRAAFPCEPGETLFINDANPGLKTCENGTIKIRGDWRQTMSTHWFHDHMIDFTAPNVYKGNAAMMNYYSAIDRGNEAIDDGVNLRLPSGSALSWGNRDYDVNLLLAGKAWDKDGQLWFNIFNKNGFLGDRFLVNWLYKPYMEVRERRYRFRILNGSVSRYLKIALVQEVKGRTTGEIRGRRGQKVSWNRIPFHMVANDGNIMEHAIPFDGKHDLDGDGNAAEHKGMLPVQAIAERHDIVVDFAAHGLKPGDKLYFVNVLEHKDGKVVEGSVSLGAVLRETYKAELEFKDGQPDEWVDGDPVVGKFLEFRIQPYDGIDQSMNPAEYEPGGKKMIPLVFNRDDKAQMAELENARHRTFKFGRSSGTDSAPWTIKTDGGNAYTADTRRLSVAPQLANGPTEAGFAGDGTTEIWRLETGGGWSHPIHIHFEEGIILYQDGEAPPAWHRWARKDVFRIGPEEEAARDMDIYYQFREFAGSYVEHCHNTQHEDHAMLLRWDIEQPGQVQLMPAPIPTWDGVKYVDSIALPTFRSGDGFGLQD